MKKTKYIGIAMAFGTLCALSSCQADMDTPDLDVPVATIQPNITLLELKTAYENKYSQPIYMPGTWKTDEDGNILSGDPVYVHGRVVSSDASGNIYKSLVIQDETAALAFSLNQSNMYTTYRLGQEVVVNLTGLYMGYYSGLQQVGYPDGDYNGVPQVGSMAYDYWLKSSQLNGLPDPAFQTVNYGSSYPTDKFYMIRFKNFSELSNGTLPELQSQLVEFKNVHFQFENDQQKLQYAVYQENTNLTLVDADGVTLTVRNSGYSNFYYKEVPRGTGTVRGILSYYQSSWQLVLRDVSDVIIGKQGEYEDPFTVAEVISRDYEDMTGWVKGYIVGSVKAGVSAVNSNDDIDFGTDAYLYNNVVIAASPDVTDWEQCVVVELPQNTILRYAVNLLDNPGVYKQELLVKGTLSNMLGLAAVTGSPGTVSSFEINGKQVEDPSAPPAAVGDGTEENPFNVTAVMESTEDLKDVWVEGYVAGYVSQGNFGEENNSFTDNGTSSNFVNGTNVILSALQMPFCATGNSVPAQLTASVKPVLSLYQNPSVFGKKVKVKCRIADYLGTRGIRQISSVTVLE